MMLRRKIPFHLFLARLCQNWLVRRPKLFYLSVYYLLYSFGTWKRNPSAYFNLRSNFSSELSRTKVFCRLSEHFRRPIRTWSFQVSCELIIIFGTFASWVYLLQTDASIVVSDCLCVVIVRQNSFLEIIIVGTLLSDWRGLWVPNVSCQSSTWFEIRVEVRLRVRLSCFGTWLGLSCLVSPVKRFSWCNWVLLPSLEPVQLTYLELRAFLSTPFAS
jgi:hypothetical protein